MQTNHWLSYFEGNARIDQSPGPSLGAEVPIGLQAPLARSLGRFQLGESAGGRIHREIAEHRDRALDAATRRSIQLYIEEEWRHARELALLIFALGGELQSTHWTNAAFTGCRRLLGLRTKMMTLAVAEVIGIVYYRALAAAVGSAALAESLNRIANEEGRHLDFQTDFFERVLASTPVGWRGGYRLLLAAQLWVIFAAALLVLLVDHGRVLRAARVRLLPLCGQARLELSSRSFLAPLGQQRERQNSRPRGPLRLPASL